MAREMVTIVQRLFNAEIWLFAGQSFVIVVVVVVVPRSKNDELTSLLLYLELGSPDNQGVAIH